MTGVEGRGAREGGEVWIEKGDVRNLRHRLKLECEADALNNDGVGVTGGQRMHLLC